MKNMTLRRALALALALVMMLAMAACAPQSEQGGEVASDWEGDTVLPPDAELTLLVTSHASWPYNEEWEFWKYFKEAVGGNINVNAVSNDEVITKVNLLMATPKDLPDLISGGKLVIDSHLSSGACIALDDRLDEMPNYTAFLESLDPTVKEELLMQAKYADGKVYIAPAYGSQQVNNFRTWMYRKDIFDKHGLEVPENLDELYEVAKKLKELYPDSYPLCFRTGLTQFDIMGPAWANDFYMDAYYDFQAEEWKYGAITDTMKEMILFFKKFREEGLVPPDFLSIASSSWEELISTDRGFIMPEYLVRITYFNTPNQKRNPDYEWHIMPPPAKDASSDHHKIAKTNLTGGGYSVANTGDEESIANAIKVLDWMYSEEAIQLLSWGKEGETYRVNDKGEKEIIMDSEESAQYRYGIATSGLYQVIEEAAFNQVVASGSEVDPIMQTWPEDHANPTLYLSLSDEEKDTISRYGDAITTYVDENVSHFIDGVKPMEEWDEFVETVKSMGVDEVLKVYEGAYNRTMGK